MKERTVECIGSDPFHPSPHYQEVLGGNNHNLSIAGMHIEYSVVYCIASIISYHAMSVSLIGGQRRLLSVTMVSIFTRQ